MKRQLILLLGLSALATLARAEDPLPLTDPLPPGAFTSAQQSDDWKIKNALSAAPAVIAEKATVMDWPTLRRPTAGGNSPGQKLTREAANPGA
jgi:hypothetical protein